MTVLLTPLMFRNSIASLEMQSSFTAGLLHGIGDRSMASPVMC